MIQKLKKIGVISHSPDVAIVAGLTVANCYYNQPLLELIHTTWILPSRRANLITVITQMGYALGLFFLIPLGDMLSCKNSSFSV